MMDVYMEYGAIGIIVSLFVMMIMNLIKSQKAQNEDLDQIRVDIGRIEGTIENCESIILKMLDRWNKSDDSSLRHRETMVGELHDLSDVMMEVKGALSRINGRN